MSPEQHIIVVDDDSDLADLMGMVISQYTHGRYVVQIYDNPQKALKYAQENRPDLVISDVNMPWLSGPALLISLDRLYRKPRIPAIFVTGARNKTEPDFARCLRLVNHGRAILLPKPFNNEEFAGLVENILSGDFKPDGNPHGRFRLAA